MAWQSVPVCSIRQQQQHSIMYFLHAFTFSTFPYQIQKCTVPAAGTEIPALVSSFWSRVSRLHSALHAAFWEILASHYICDVTFTSSRNMLVMLNSQIPIPIHSCSFFKHLLFSFASSSCPCNRRLWVGWSDAAAWSRPSVYAMHARTLCTTRVLLQPTACSITCHDVVDDYLIASCICQHCLWWHIVPVHSTFSHSSSSDKPGPALCNKYFSKNNLFQLKPTRVSVFSSSTQ